MIQGAVVGAFHGVETALQTVEVMIGVAEGIAEQGAFVVAGKCSGVLELALPDLRLDFAEAAKEPVGGSEGIDEDAFLRGGGPEAVLVAGGEVLESGEILATDDERPGVNAGFQGIQGGGGLARGGAWAGRFHGIAPVGVGLRGGRHRVQT
jgi:hypothetical protein